MSARKHAKKTRKGSASRVMKTRDETAKSHDHSFEVLQKSKIGNFSVVTLRVATLKIPDLVFFAIHPKFLIGTFGSLVTRLCSTVISERWQSVP